MEESILVTVKKLLGIMPDYDCFDLDIIIHINTILSALIQIGVGTPGFQVVDEIQTWKGFIGDKEIDLNMIKSYVYLKVKLLFDPPVSSSVMDAYKKNADEYEWRMYSMFNFIEKEDDNP